ncbi:hypothetical protein [Mycobacterium sp. SM3041]|uniref:hypothetical protein n=1 Tax=Mycobacterium sp. SM3041 TaxID=3114291 RepID=UPI003204895C
MFDGVFVRRCGSMAFTLIGAFGTAGVAWAPPAAADVVEEYVRGYCSPPNGQDCNARPSIHFDAHIAEKVLASFNNDANGCSDIVVRFYLDGRQIAAPAIARPGSTVTAPPAYTKTAGGHELSVSATGIKGGCNTGTLEAFGGTLSANVIELRQ